MPNKLLHKKADCFDYIRKLDILNISLFERIMETSEDEIIKNLDKLYVLNIKVCYRCMNEKTARFVWRSWSNFGAI